MRSKDKLLRITCDGGAATGKSTGAKLIAKKYKLAFLSSGLLYRYTSFLILKYNPKNKISFLKKKIKNLNYKKLNKINLHTQTISTYSATIAKISGIRNILKTATNSGCKWFIVEQDECSGDPFDSLQISYNNLVKYAVT